jgi:SAM-dependent methyltransferase
VTRARSQLSAEPSGKAIRGDRRTQCEVLVALSSCANHRRWFAGFARPYLGDSPIEVGSGLGHYAREWIPLVPAFTATDADPDLVVGLKQEMAGYPHVEVRQLLLPSAECGEHSCVICYNVLEHIEDDVSALASMAALARPGGHLIVVCPAFPFAMSPVDVATGHVRRYTKRSMRSALEAAGLEVADLRYANSVGLLCYYTFTGLLRRKPAAGATMVAYDRLVVPVVRALERLVRRPPFGQSVVAVARVPGQPGR